MNSQKTTDETLWALAKASEESAFKLYFFAKKTGDDDQIAASGKTWRSSREALWEFARTTKPEHDMLCMRSIPHDGCPCWCHGDAMHCKLEVTP